MKLDRDGMKTIVHTPKGIQIQDMMPLFYPS